MLPGGCSRLPAGSRRLAGGPMGVPGGARRFPGGSQQAHRRLSGDSRLEEARRWFQGLLCSACPLYLKVLRL